MSRTIGKKPALELPMTTDLSKLPARAENSALLKSTRCGAPVVGAPVVGAPVVGALVVGALVVYRHNPARVTTSGSEKPRAPQMLRAPPAIHHHHA